MNITYAQAACVMLQSLMKTRRVSQQTLAEAIGTNNASISRQLNGDVKLTVDNVCAMLTVLKVGFNQYYLELEEFIAYLKLVGVTVSHHKSDITIAEVRSFHWRYLIGDTTIRIVKKTD